MKVIIQYDDGTERRYEADEESAKRIEGGELFHIITQHPKFNEFYRLFTIVEKEGVKDVNTDNVVESG